MDRTRKTGDKTMGTPIYKVEAGEDGSYAVTARTFPARRAGEFGAGRDYPEERMEIRRFNTKAEAQAFAAEGNGRA